MKFTKKDIGSIKYYNNIINKIMEVNKLYENRINKEVPRSIKINLIKYGIYVGRIFEIIHRRINFKDLEKNENADELIKETFGESFFIWLTKKNKQFLYGDNKSSNIDTSDIDIMHN